jgi:hypothetical protein
MCDTHTLFIADEGRRPLQAIARDVFTALGITEHEERFSSNYPPDDHYFVGYALNVGIDVFDFEEIKPGYPYALSIEGPTYRRGKNPAPADPETIARLVARAGFRVFVPEGPWGKREWDGAGTEYAL